MNRYKVTFKKGDATWTVLVHAITGAAAIYKAREVSHLNSEWVYTDVELYHGVN